ncbi:hypothetical protein BC828DRAFT_392542, partial [Blastocladiella britannica]
TQYAVEYAKTGRSKCSAGKACSAQIQKGELRLGTHFESEATGHNMTKYRHWKCTTQKVIESINASENGLGGLDTLTEEDKAMVEADLEKGFIEDGTESVALAAKEAEKQAKLQVRLIFFEGVRT